MAKAKAATVTKAIKGFDANLQCRGFQFEVGQTYTHKGKVEACAAGFHAVPEDLHPLTVFQFYSPAGSRFCRVEVSGKIDRETDKIAAEHLPGDEIATEVRATIVAGMQRISENALTDQRAM